MAFNVRIDEAVRIIVKEEKEVKYDELPSYIKEFYDTKKDNAGGRGPQQRRMRFYEISLVRQSFEPEVDFTRWELKNLKADYLSHKENNTFSSSVKPDRSHGDDDDDDESELKIDKKKKKLPRLSNNNNGKRALTRKQQTLNEKKRKQLIANTTHMMRAKYSYSLESGITVIDKESFCLLTGRPFDGNYYILLMTHPLPDKKTDTNISFGNDPIHEIFLHNNLLANDRSTGSVAPYWGADAIIGPIVTFNKAKKCSKEMVFETRGKIPKRNKSIEIHRKYNLNLYLANLNDVVPYKELVEVIAPPQYITAYRDLFVTKKQTSKKDE
jgi:hypothetical protein